MWIGGVEAGRLLILLAALVLAYLCAFRGTPELDGVENAFFYRLFFAIAIVRGVAFYVFDVAGLFKL